MYKGKKIIAINYCDKLFELQRNYNTKTAYSKGKVDEVIEYSITDIDEEFLKKNASIFSVQRGAGLWLWKPYLILKTLKLMNEGDFLFYCDAGAYYVNSVSKLVDNLENCNGDVMSFELPLISRQWTKKETFTTIGFDSSCQNQILAGYILIRNTDYSRKIIAEWLYYMQDERCASPKQITEEANYDDFVAHREDQSVFSIICRKYQIQPFRDPSQYGDRPYEYAWRKGYSSFWKRYSFRKKRYTNSAYPKIVVSNRKSDPIKYKLYETIINFLWRIGVYNELSYKWKYKTEYN